MDKPKNEPENTGECPSGHNSQSISEYPGGWGCPSQRLYHLETVLSCQSSVAPWDHYVAAVTGALIESGIIQEVTLSIVSPLDDDDESDDAGEAWTDPWSVSKPLTEKIRRAVADRVSSIASDIADQLVLARKERLALSSEALG